MSTLELLLLWKLLSHTFSIRVSLKDPWECLYLKYIFKIKQRALHGFEQAKFTYGGLVWLKPIFTAAPAASKKRWAFLKWSKLTPIIRDTPYCMWSQTTLKKWVKNENTLNICFSTWSTLSQALLVFSTLITLVCFHLATSSSKC
jgi:hypothetical protein